MSKRCPKEFDYFDANFIVSILYSNQIQCFNFHGSATQFSSFGTTILPGINNGDLDRSKENTDKIMDFTCYEICIKLYILEYIVIVYRRLYWPCSRIICHIKKCLLIWPFARFEACVTHWCNNVTVGHPYHGGVQHPT